MKDRPRIPRINANIRAHSCNSRSTPFKTIGIRIQSNVEEAEAWNSMRLSKPAGCEVLDRLFEDLLLHVLLVRTQLRFCLFAQLGDGLLTRFRFQGVEYHP